MYVCVYQSVYEKDQKQNLWFPCSSTAATWFPSSYHNNNKTKNQEFKENFTLLSSSPSSLPLYLCSQVACENKRFVVKWVVQTIKTDATYYFFAIWAHSPPVPPSDQLLQSMCSATVFHLLMWEKSQLTISYLVLAPPPPLLSLLAKYQVLLPFPTSFTLVRSKSIYCVRHTNIQLGY